MKFIGQLLVCFALAGASGAAAAATSAPADAAYLSFAELYRLTVSGSAAVDFAAVTPEPSASQGASAAPQGASAAPQGASRGASAGSEYQVRPVSTVSAWTLAQAPQAPVATYSISGASLPAAPRWLLLASGLALAAWVARRRLGYSL
jgi:hypothetical protein